MEEFEARMKMSQADMVASWLRDLPNIGNYFAAKQMEFDPTLPTGEKY